ncbi:right-handed parallel beta-helix repeat-containing protein [candidate division KSB1 bacterium]|nr:right-handed parallel beta-helix repeat-containing protein [candidate division KSB1 bacterium]
MNKVILFLAILLAVNPSYPQWYVATDGKDENPGTIDQPLGTIPKAISLSAPGDTIYVRGGTHLYKSAITISYSQSGTETQRRHLFAYPGERPLLDFSQSDLGVKGISLRGNYWYIKGLDVKGAGDNGLEINGGSHNIIEWCTFFENRDSGVQLSNLAAHNQIINCDSYYNADPPDWGDADGFAPKLAVGTGNYFYGCRAWDNCDDGWDGYLRGGNDVTTTLENCWTWHNGYLPDGTNPGAQANGNGFKMGGGDSGNSERLMHHFVLHNCVAFDNKNKGFDQNNNVGSMTLLNCSGFRNLEANYRIQKTLNEGQSLIVKNGLSLYGAIQLGSFAIQETNSWMPPFVVTADDFLSLDGSLASAPRQADGSLPEIDFLHLSAGSDLIDGGTDVGLPYLGKAPDLGAFESNYATLVAHHSASQLEFTLLQNYPNPFNPGTTIAYSLHKQGQVDLAVYNLSGQKVATLVDGEQAAGAYRLQWRPNGLAAGMYFYRLQTQDGAQIKRLILQR